MSLYDKFLAVELLTLMLYGFLAFTISLRGQEDDSKGRVQALQMGALDLPLIFQ